MADDTYDIFERGVVDVVKYHSKTDPDIAKRYKELSSPQQVRDLMKEIKRKEDSRIQAGLALPGKRLPGAGATKCFDNLKLTNKITDRKGGIINTIISDNNIKKLDDFKKRLSGAKTKEDILSISSEANEMERNKEITDETKDLVLEEADKFTKQLDAQAKKAAAAIAPPTSVKKPTTAGRLIFGNWDRSLAQQARNERAQEYGRNYNRSLEKHMNDLKFGPETKLGVRILDAEERFGPNWYARSSPREHKKIFGIPLEVTIANRLDNNINIPASSWEYVETASKILGRPDLNRQFFESQGMNKTKAMKYVKEQAGI